MVEQREPGWYWVNGTPRRWCETGWEFPGHARLLPDAGMEIGPRILPPSAAPSQPQDLVAETVFDPEPGQPSNPAVERKPFVTGPGGLWKDEHGNWREPGSGIRGGGA